LSCSRLASLSRSPEWPSKRLRLAYVTTGYPYVSHTFILNEVLALREQGVEINTFAIRREPESECRTAEDREAWETTYALRPPRLAHYVGAHLRGLLTRPRAYLAALGRSLEMSAGAPASLVRHLAYFVQAVVLWDRCRVAGVRHIHAHFANVASDVALLASILGGHELSWSFTMHGPTEFYDVSRNRLAEKTRSAEFVVAISDFARSQLMGLVSPSFWPKLHVVHCGVDIRRFSRPPDCPERSEAQIVCVGRLVPAKAQTLLVETIAALRAAGAEAHLTLVGDGPDRQSLERLANDLQLTDHVTFLGSVAHSEVQALLSEADIFCLPSFAEGVPIVLMEAMAMELPVVSSKVMGIPELIEDQISGVLIRPGALEDLVRALSELVGSPERRRELGRAARLRVEREYELHANARALHDIFRGYLDGSAQV
jgi:colanic acid/amylovoran biosynthesis glycosyltransferase